MGLSKGAWAGIAVASVVFPQIGIPFLLFGLGPTLQADAQYKAAKAQADAAKAEGKIRQAEANQNARQMRMNHQRILAAQRVAVAHGGVVAEGTALDVLASNAGEFELDAVTRERYGANAKSLANAAAKNYIQQGQYGIATSVIGGVTDTVKMAGMALL